MPEPTSNHRPRSLAAMVAAVTLAIASAIAMASVASADPTSIAAPEKPHTAPPPGWSCEKTMSGGKKRWDCVKPGWPPIQMHTLCHLQGGQIALDGMSCRFPRA